MKKYLAEFMGTFCLVFAGTGAVVVDQVSGGALGAVGVGLVFGLVVFAMICAIGPVSGAHMNPAVTMGLYSAGRHPSSEILPYLAAQLSGAVMASVLLRILFAGVPTHLGMTLPAGPVLQSLGLEFLMTFMLMLVVMSVITGVRPPALLGGLAIAGTIAFEAMMGGPISGASMNPARSFGPALIMWDFHSHWIYWTGPLLGSLAGVQAQKLISSPRQP